MAIFIIFPFAGFYFGYQYALNSFIPPKPAPVVVYIQITPTPSVAPAVPTVTPVTSGIKNGSQIWANILESKTINNSTHLLIDYLERNPCWTPGGPPKPGCTNGDFYLNKIPEKIDVPLAPNAKLYNCNGTVPDAEGPLETFSYDWQNYESPVDYYLDINHNQITALYQRCLP